MSATKPFHVLPGNCSLNIFFLAALSPRLPQQRDPHDWVGSFTPDALLGATRIWTQTFPMVGETSTTGKAKYRNYASQILALSVFFDPLTCKSVVIPWRKCTNNLGSLITAGSTGAKYTGISHPACKLPESLAPFHSAELAECCIMTLFKWQGSRRHSERNEKEGVCVCVKVSFLQRRKVLST